jgi:hypothetical protein
MLHNHNTAIDNKLIATLNTKVVLARTKGGTIPLTQIKVCVVFHPVRIRIADDHHCPCVSTEDEAAVVIVVVVVAGIHFLDLYHHVHHHIGAVAGAHQVNHHHTNINTLLLQMRLNIT